MTLPPDQPSISGSLPGAVHNASETATTALYRAALGPVNIGRYLPVFARFDEVGRAGPSWNWAAALLTLNWLVFRQLWGTALVYVAAVEGLVVLVLGLGRGWLAWPSLAEWGLLGAIGVLSCLVPGLYGNAWLHADARRRMTRAVREAKTVREACAQLAQRGSSRQRLLGLAMINGVLVIAVVGTYWSLSRWVPERPLQPEPIVRVPQVLAPLKPAPVEPPPVVPQAAVTPAPEPVSVPAEPATAPLPAPAWVPPAAEPAAVEPARAAGFAINVGLFADAGNADRVLMRLLDAGLPAYLQVVDSPNGQRTRVRVGPYASRALADDAAARIRSLGLDAVVFRS